MAGQLYVFETRYASGHVTRGTAGLPYFEMVKYREFIVGCEPEIVCAPAGTPLLQVVTPMQRKIMNNHRDP